MSIKLLENTASVAAISRTNMSAHMLGAKACKLIGSAKGVETERILGTNIDFMQYDEYFCAF